MDRPSSRELTAKLKEAREAAASGRINMVEPVPILADLLNLDFLMGDLVKELPGIIGEISPKHERGKRVRYGLIRSRYSTLSSFLSDGKARSSVASCI